MPTSLAKKLARLDAVILDVTYTLGRELSREEELGITHFKASRGLKHRLDKLYIDREKLVEQKASERNGSIRDIERNQKIHTKQQELLYEYKELQRATETLGAITAITQGKNGATEDDLQRFRDALDDFNSSKKKVGYLERSLVKMQGCSIEQIREEFKVKQPNVVLPEFATRIDGKHSERLKQEISYEPVEFSLNDLLAKMQDNKIEEPSKVANINEEASHVHDNIFDLIK
jgi:hypothetical protein